MKRNKLLLTSIFIVCIIALIASCATNPFRTFDRTNVYNGMEILRFQNSQAYLFPNLQSDKLLIVIEGSSWLSVLGYQRENRWMQVHMGAQLLQELRNDYNILILEKLNRKPGLNYIDDMEDRANYTAENLITGYLESISGHLASATYSSIVLFGVSEGALLLPIIYQQMNNKDDITAMVSFAFGGLSMYESYQIFADTITDAPDGWKARNNYVLINFAPTNEFLPESYKEIIYGNTERWLSSFVHIRPFDYFVNIDIPTLFIHGNFDEQISAMSTDYIQQNLPEKPFEFYYYDWGHSPTNAREMIALRRDIAQWIRDINNER